MFDISCFDIPFPKNMVRMISTIYYSYIRHFKYTSRMFKISTIKKLRNLKGDNTKNLIQMIKPIK